MIPQPSSIESCCVVCHGPVLQTRPRTPTAITCNGDGGNCRSNWRHMVRGKALPTRAATLRVMHAYRREMMAAQDRLLAMLSADGWLEVG